MDVSKSQSIVSSFFTLFLLSAPLFSSLWLMMQQDGKSFDTSFNWRQHDLPHLMQPQVVQHRMGLAAFLGEVMDGSLADDLAQHLDMASIRHPHVLIDLLLYDGDLVIGRPSLRKGGRVCFSIYQPTRRFMVAVLTGVGVLPKPDRTDFFMGRTRSTKYPVVYDEQRPASTCL
ncbi:hypothetical protein B0T17DRAFT_168813 [Bombardia bombarda]|uniref:Uncharacterized protein n=1 Tax=Bombardia bombarda TaxID=252184 RepID=A0AA40C895_9PEZI|nr:hypothetical protein B0T17DRAFT_168813 [Bombardia bombarda]